MNENLLKELEVGIIERLGNALLKSNEYKQAITREKTAYERLVKVLTAEQKEILEEYYNSLSISTMLLQKTAYKQGVADFAVLLMNDKEGIAHIQNTNFVDKN